VVGQRVEVTNARAPEGSSPLGRGAARTELTREAQLLAVYAGANSIFYGDRLLTTPNPGPDADESLLRDAGLTPMAAAPGA